jgi:hypothetical protein
LEWKYLPGVVTGVVTSGEGILINVSRKVRPPIAEAGGDDKSGSQRQNCDRVSSVVAGLHATEELKA